MLETPARGRTTALNTASAVTLGAIVGEAEGQDDC
jgi:hypothetical protein